MHIDALVECPVHDSFRVRQVAGMFDVAVEAKCQVRFSVELPDLDEPWQIGAIVGPSGSGKTTVARAAYGDALYRGHDWPADSAVIDCFGKRPTKQITQMLTAVGFSSPPAWVKPYPVLSGGERFRCDLARALLCGGPLVAFDEFTSVVDRTVAQIGSAAVARAIRRGGQSSVVNRQSSVGCQSPKSLAAMTNDHGQLTTDHGQRRFVAVTCHYDVLPWLEADWVLDMATGTLDRFAVFRHCPQASKCV